VVLARRDAGAARRMAAFALLAVAAYGIIAAGRLGFYATGRDMLIAAERYHYAGSLALAVLFCLSLDVLGRRLRVRSRVATALLVLWLAASGIAFATVRRPIDQHDVQRTFAEQALGSLRRLAVSAGSDEIYVANQPFAGVGPLMAVNPAVFPRLGALFLVYHPDGRLEGRRVRFVETDRRVLAATARGVRSRWLFVAPDAVPAGAEVLEPDLRAWRWPVPMPTAPPRRP
ncbi:MAG TPA: hypothetical protein VKA21_05920, partial [Candidatus Binatia bacterium]|nr:hypothetical protein [Candidatus Binatia bacterium]